MTETNHRERVSLSALDFLGLADQRKVAVVDLAEVGYQGLVYVCDLTAGQQQKLMSGPSKGRTRVYADKSMDVDWADMPRDAAARFLEACLVTDSSGGSKLQEAFDQAGDDSGFITFPSSELVRVYDLIVAELKNPRAAREKLEQLPNAVVSVIILKMRELSGMTEDQVEEKKETS